VPFDATPGFTVDRLKEWVAGERGHGQPPPPPPSEEEKEKTRTKERGEEL
jgi:hypothetical protein